jgi:hypothetical protein
LGYFIGAAFLAWSYYAALAAMVVIIASIVPFALFGLDDTIGTAKKVVLY